MIFNYSGFVIYREFYFVDWNFIAWYAYFVLYIGTDDALIYSRSELDILALENYNDLLLRNKIMLVDHIYKKFDLLLDLDRFHHINEHILINDLLILNDVYFLSII